MTAPTLISVTPTSYSTTGVTSKATASISVQAGDILVAKAAMENGWDTGTSTNVFINISDSAGNTWTRRHELAHTGAAVDNNVAYVTAWTAVAAATGSTTVTFAQAGTVNNVLHFGGEVEVWRGSDGVGATNVATNGTGANAAPSVSVTTTQDNSALSVIDADWNATTGTDTWTTTAGTPTNRSDFSDAASYGVHTATYADVGTAGSKTVGMSAPATQRYGIIVIEVKGTVPAWTRVQGATNAGSSPSLSVTLSAVGLGNAVVGQATCDSSGGVTIQSVADDKGNTYSLGLDVVDTTNNQRARSFWRGNITNAPTVITVTYSGSAAATQVNVDEFSGPTLVDPSDGQTGQIQSSPGTATDAITSTNVTTAAAGDLIWGATTNTSLGTNQATAGTGFATGTAGTVTVATLTEYKTQTNAGSVAATFTQAVNNSHITHVVALKKDVGAKYLSPSLFTESDAFHRPTIGGGTRTRGIWRRQPSFRDTRFALLKHSKTEAAYSIALFEFEFTAGGGLQPALYLDADAFYSPAITTSYTLTPSLHSDADTFFAPVVAGVQTLTPSLYSDTDTFYVPAVTTTYALTPSLYSDTDAFFASTVQPGAVNLAPSLLTAADVFFAPVVSATYALSPALYVDSDALLAPTVASTAGLLPALYSDVDTVYSPTVQPGAVNLSPPLHSEADAFYAATVAPGAVALAPSLHTSADAFFAPAISATYNLAPSLHTSADAFFAPAVSATYALTPLLYADADTTYSPVVSSAGSTTLLVPLYADTDAFYAPTAQPGAVSISPALHADADAFYSPAATPSYTLTASLHADTDFFYTLSVGAQALSPSLYVDADIFPTVALAYGLVASRYADTDAFYATTVTTSYLLQAAHHSDLDLFLSPRVDVITVPTHVDEVLHGAMPLVPGMVGDLPAAQLGRAAMPGVRMMRARVH
jgi:hypothetical protein